MSRAALWTVLGLVALVWAGAAVAQTDRPTAGMKARVFELKHQETGSVINAIRPLGSTVPGALITESDTLRTITVRDYPENLAAIEQALRRLDTPSAPRPDVELRLRVLIGAPSGAGAVPPELEAVVKQLQSTLTFKSYYQVAHVTNRLKVGSGSSGKGSAQIVPPASDEATTAEFQYGLENLSMTPPSGAQPVLAFRKFRFSLQNKVLGDAELSTGLQMKEVQSVVVGAASLRNRAVIVVVSAKLLK